MKTTLKVRPCAENYDNHDNDHDDNNDDNNDDDNNDDDNDKTESAALSFSALLPRFYILRQQDENDSVLLFYSSDFYHYDDHYGDDDDLLILCHAHAFTFGGSRMKMTRSCFLILPTSIIVNDHDDYADE